MGEKSRERNFVFAVGSGKAVVKDGVELPHMDGRDRIESKSHWSAVLRRTVDLLTLPLRNDGLYHRINQTSFTPYGRSIDVIHKGGSKIRSAHSQSHTSQKNPANHWEFVELSGFPDILI